MVVTKRKSKTESKPHFSASQLDSYCMCPESYRQWYLEKNRIPPTVHMARGTGMHGGAAFNLRQKIESGVDLPRKEIIDAGIAEYEGATKDGLMLTREEAGRGHQVVIAEVKDDLVAILDCHAKTQAPEYQPVMVEQAVRVELPKAPRDLLAVLDVATATEVADFKTAKRSKSQGDVDSSLQLTVYSIAFHVVQGHAPETVALDTIVQGKKETKRQKLVGTRDEADYLALVNRINAVQHAIDAGSFPPTVPGSWKCSEKYCGYYRSCPFVNGSRSQGD
jgi:hypothetical protein